MPGHCSEENDARFVKSPGKNAKLEVAGEGLAPDGGVLSRQTVLWEPPGTGQMLSHGTWAVRMELQAWEGRGIGPQFPVGIWKGRATIPSPGSPRQLQPGDPQRPGQARGQLLGPAARRTCFRSLVINAQPQLLPSMRIILTCLPWGFCQANKRPTEQRDKGRPLTTKEPFPHRPPKRFHARRHLPLKDHDLRSVAFSVYVGD